MSGPASIRMLFMQRVNTVVISGGEGSNQRSREQAKTMLRKSGGLLFYPRLEFCTDEGAMIF